MRGKRIFIGRNKSTEDPFVAFHKGHKEGYKEGYNTAIEEMQGNLIRNSRTEIVDGEICLIVTDKRIKQIAEQMMFR